MRPFGMQCAAGREPTQAKRRQVRATTFKSLHVDRFGSGDGSCRGHTGSAVQLVLNCPVTLTSQGGATLLFPPGRRRSSLDDGHQDPLRQYDAERFRRPLRRPDPLEQSTCRGDLARIGMTDNLDQGHRSPKVGSSRSRVSTRKSRRSRKPGSLGRGAALDEADPGQERRDRGEHPPGRPDRVLRRTMADRRQRLPGHTAGYRSTQRASSRAMRHSRPRDPRQTRRSGHCPAARLWRFLVLTW